MIKQVSGDILLSGAAAIAHGVAPDDDFKSELAAALRERWPAMYKEIDREGLASIALPRLATGVGRLDWDDIAPVIARHLGTLEIPVYVYVDYIPGAKAAIT